MKKAFLFAVAILAQALLHGSPAVQGEESARGVGAEGEALDGDGESRCESGVERQLRGERSQ